MKKLVFLFLIISSASFAQELKLISEKMQTINHGASPVSSTTYYILLKKAKKAAWKIDSVVSTSSGQSIEYSILKVNDPTAANPEYTKVESYAKSDVGDYQIKFGVRKQRGSGRPGSPQNTKVDTTTIDGGVIIYYTMKKKHKQLKINEFEQLETIDGP